MLRIVVLLAAGLAMSGCATIARGTNEQMAFDTVPSGAEVRVVLENKSPPSAEDVQTPPTTMGCVTPCVLQIKRLDKMAVTVTKPGFETEAFSLVPQASGEGVATSVAGNMLLAGGVVGLVVDGASGAGLDKCPNPVRIALRPVQAAPPRGRPVSARQAEQRFGYDPVAACKDQTAAKYNTSSQTAPNQGAM